MYVFTISGKTMKGTDFPLPRPYPQPLLLRDQAPVSFLLFVPGFHWPSSMYIEIFMPCLPQAFLFLFFLWEKMQRLK
jgi:hypothetical protein